MWPIEKSRRITITTTKTTKKTAEQKTQQHIAKKSKIFQNKTIKKLKLKKKKSTTTITLTKKSKKVKETFFSIQMTSILNYLKKKLNNLI